MRELVPFSIVELEPAELTFLSGNRLVDDVHVNTLANKLKEENLLHLNPIKITPKKGIIDGQHRVKACMILGIKKVPCLVISGTIHHAAKLNQNNKNWSLMDFANYWSKQGKTGYIDFIEFVNLTGLHSSVAMELLMPSGGRSGARFREGNFVPRSGGVKFAYNFIDKLEAFKEWLPHDYRKKVFVRAVWSLYNSKRIPYDHERMIHKLRITGMTPRATMDAYVEQLEHAYNWKVKPTDRVKFIE